MATPLWLIDHSHHEPDLDWARLKREGYVAVVHKATEGTDFTDTTYKRRIAAIRAAGLIPGAYHWLHSADPKGQVAHFLDVIGDPEGLLIQLDWEDEDDIASPAVARAWVNEWRARTGGHPVLIYLPPWYWRDKLHSPPGLSDLGPAWASHYIKGTGTASALYPTVPGSWWESYGGWRRPKVLQFTDSGQAAGVSKLDLNAFDGTLAELRALTSRTGIPTTSNGGGTTLMGRSFDQVMTDLDWQLLSPPGREQVQGTHAWRIQTTLDTVARIESKLEQLQTAVDVLNAKLDKVATPQPTPVNAATLGAAFRELFGQLGG